MSLIPDISPHLARVLTSNRLLRLKRQLYQGRHQLARSFSLVSAPTAWFYCKADDPYSYLMCQALIAIQDQAQNQAQNTLDIRLCIIQDLPTTLNPEPDKQKHYALNDAPRLAQYTGLAFPQSASLPSETASRRCTQALLKAAASTKPLTQAREVLQGFWQDVGTGSAQETVPTFTASELTQEQKTQLQNNQQRLDRQGHYNSATLYFDGEWYWGVDRLGHLEARLNIPPNKQGFNRPRLLALKSKPVSPLSQDRRPILDFYFSFRSPYSYLALPRLRELIKSQPYQLRIKAVLPMVMRGLPVPAKKRFYILKDAKREANALGMPFGFIRDPLGQGIQHCLAILDVASTQLDSEAQLDLLETLATGIWSQALNTADLTSTLKAIEGFALAREDIKSALESNHWQDKAEQHREDLSELGLWGVPAFHSEHLTCWGQDRLWVLTEDHP
jgi:2-hydroxychromene-2-carboxylate isomerase